MAEPQSLRAYVGELMTAAILPRPPAEEWADMILRIQAPERVAEIDEDTWWYFLEVLPPKFQGGGFFAFAEDTEPLRLFVKRPGRYLARQLTWDETHRFCRLAGIPLPS